jgi:hypothetical protein
MSKYNKIQRYKNTMVPIDVEQNTDTVVDPETILEVSRLDMIIQHIQKPKKLALPKGYVRNHQKRQNELVDIVDCLEVENNLITSKPSQTNIHVNVYEPEEKVKKEKEAVIKKHIKKAEKVVKSEASSNTNTNDGQNLDVSNEGTTKKTRNPTAYNIYVKETVKKLQETRKELTPKERFNLAIRMWSDQKSQQ